MLEMFAAEPLPEPGPPPAYEPPVTPVTPILPAATVALDDLVRIERAWRQEIQNVIIPELERTMRKAADAVLSDIAFEAPVLWNASQPQAQKFLTQTKNQLVGVGEDMWMKTRDQLILGMQDGESIQQLSARVKEVLSTTDTRARAIARTEVIGASNAGAMQQLELLGEDAPERKTWLSTRDGRTRLSHAAANGQTVDFVAPFTVGGAKLDYPGDPDAPASERVNCRCTLVWHYDDLPLQTPVPITSAGPLEMFHLKGKHNQHDHAGGDGGHAGGGGGGSKKVLKPANVDTSRLNAAEAGELADIQAKHAAGELTDKEAKYKTYYVKVKASKRINKSGGAGKGTELDTKVGDDKPKVPPTSYVPGSSMTPGSTPTPGKGLKPGDEVVMPSGMVGTVKSTKDNKVLVETSAGKTIIGESQVKKKYPDIGDGDGGDLKNGDQVKMPSGKPAIIVGQTGDSATVITSDGDSFVIKKSKLSKDSKAPDTTPIKKGDTVETPNGPAKVLNETPSLVFVEYPNGDVAFHAPSKVSKAGAEPASSLRKGDLVTSSSGAKGKIIAEHSDGTVDVATSDGDVFVYDKKTLKKSSLGGDVNDGDNVNTPGGPGTVIKKNSKGVLVEHPGGGQDVYDHESVTKQPPVPGVKPKLGPVGSVNTGGGGSSTPTPAPKKTFVKPSQVDAKTHFNAAEHAEMDDISKKYAAGEISETEYKKKAYYVKVKASKRINKNAGVSKPSPGGVSSDVPGISTNAPGIKLNPGGLDVTPAPLPPKPAVLQSRTSSTRKMAEKNAENLQGKLRSDLTVAKNNYKSWDDPTVGPMLKAHSSYTGSGYTPINMLARTGSTGGGMPKHKAAAHIKNLDNAFHTYGTTNNQPIIVHRGVRGNYSQDLKKLTPGDIITERGFMSTSTRDKKPKDFAGSYGALMEIHVPPGKRTMAGTDYEHELLFPRNTKMQYLGTSPSGALQFTMVD